MQTNVTPLKPADLLESATTARGNGRSQSTVIEQSRAIAEVQGALMVADRRPRNKPSALGEALESCRTKEVAESAFYKFPRAGGAVEGESIHLARELARCWGNITFGVVELDRDDERGVSEMMAYAWDLENNTRPETRFLVPHLRDKRGGPERLTDMRDIYENNANMGARRLRECIFSVLPPYLVRAAAEECKRTLAEGGGVPMAQRISEAVKVFDRIGVKLARLEAKFGPSGDWTDMDIVNLQISFKSIQRKEVTAEDEFPSDPLTPEMLGRSTPDYVAASSPNRLNGLVEESTEGRTDPRAVMLGEWIDRLSRAELIADVIAVEGELKPHRDALSDEALDTLDTAIANTRARLAGGAK